MLKLLLKLSQGQTNATMITSTLAGGDLNKQNIGADDKTMRRLMMLIEGYSERRPNR